MTEKPLPDLDARILAAVTRIYELHDYKRGLADDLGMDAKALSHAIRRQKGRKIDLLALGRLLVDQDGRARDGAVDLVEVLAEIVGCDVFPRLEPDAVDMVAGFRRAIAKLGPIAEVVEHDADREARLSAHLRTRRAPARRPRRDTDSEENAG